MVTSDRISAYDWVLPTEIPDKGRILNSISQWWFAQLQGLVFNHTTTSKVPKSVTGRAVVCEPLEMFPVECVVRGILPAVATPITLQLERFLGMVYRQG